MPDEAVRTEEVMTSEYITRELRWFFDEKLPAEVERWFEHDLPGDNVYSPGPRTDLYFLVKDKPDFGLKLREGKLQLKWRTFMEPFSTSDRQAQGVESTWHKDEWEFSSAENVRAGFTEPSDLKGPRIEVWKDRKQRKYSVSETCELVAVPINDRPARVAVIELTTLDTEYGPAWTLGFDAIGTPEAVEEILQCAADKLLADYPGPALTEESWAGYPKWLLRKLD